MIDLLLLGSGGMMPLPTRWLSALLVRCEGELTLFDCGEGTQIPWRSFGWGFRRLGAICLSHLHADHVAGLPGLLHSIANADRTDPITIYGPPGTAYVVAGLRTIAPVLPYGVEIRELRGGEAFPLPGGLTGRAAPGLHRVDSLIFRADIERARRFNPETARALGIPLPLWHELQRGVPVTWEGGRAIPADVLGALRRGLSVAYVTDTRPLPEMPDFLSDIDLLVCEGTYGDSADEPKATAYKHMTFAEAATLARDAGARVLWLTHFSPGLMDPAAFLTNATAIFPNSTIGFSGLTATISFEDDAPAAGERPG